MSTTASTSRNVCVASRSEPVPSDIEPKAKYDNKVRQAAIDRILVDKLNATTVQQAMQHDFLLKLSTGFLDDCLEYAIRKYDGTEFRDGGFEPRC